MIFKDIVGQEHAVTILRKGLEQNRLHHALLFWGPEGVGKESVAFALATAIVCTINPGEGCGQCDACHRASTFSSDGIAVPLHPDVVLVEKGLYSRDILGRSTEEKTDISVDQIRRVVLDRIAFLPHEAPQRIIIIRRAEELSIAAANALLKTLEEPPLHTRFVLLTSQPGALLSTIRSRTLPVRFAPLADPFIEQLVLKRGVDKNQAHEISKLAGGSVTRAIELIDPAKANARTTAIELLRHASEGPLHTLFEATSMFSNSSEDRERLREYLLHLCASEAYQIRSYATEDITKYTTQIQHAIARYDAACEILKALDRNTNPSLSLEAHWVTLANRATR